MNPVTRSNKNTNTSNVHPKHDLTPFGPHLRVLSHVRCLFERAARQFESVVHHLDATVPQGDVFPASPTHPPDGQAPPLGLPAPSPIRDGHMHEQTGVRHWISRYAEQRHIAIPGLKALEGHCVLADEIISDVVVIKHHEAQQGEFRHIDLEGAKAQIKQCSDPGQK